MNLLLAILALIIWGMLMLWDIREFFTTPKAKRFTFWGYLKAFTATISLIIFVWCFYNFFKLIPA